MDATEFAFLIFSTVILFSSGGILFTKNVIHAVLFLVLILLSIAGLYVIYNAEFLAVVQVMIYVGGIVVLMAFGIMLTSRSGQGLLIAKNQLLIPGIIVSGLLLFFLLRNLKEIRLKAFPAKRLEQVEEIGINFMSKNLLAFEFIAFLLLVVLVGAAFVAKNKEHAD